MAAELQGGRAFVDVVPDVSQFGQRLRSGVAGPIDDTSQSVNRTLGGTFEKLSKVAGGLFAGKQIFDFGAGAVDAAREANKIAAQTGAVIKSTGGAAKVTAAQVGDLADSIAAKTGVDDEAIGKAENLLLTFTNLRNEVGKGNDIFNQATKTAVDMGAALGGDAASNAIQLGKALNDPAKGLAALSRVGVTFTEEQKKQVKALQESGDILGAQKIILAELNKEFGGSAEAQATAGARLSVVWGNLQEKLGQKLIPIIEKVSIFLADKLPGALDKVGKAFIRARDFLTPTFRVLEKVARFVGDNLAPVIAGLAAAIVTVVVPAFIAWAAAAIPAAAATVAAALPVIALTAAVAAVAAGIVYAYQHFEIFRKVVDAVAGFITGTVIPVAVSVGKVFVESFQFILDIAGKVFGWIKDNWQLLLGILTGPIGLAVVAITENWDTIKNGFTAVKDWISARIDDIVGFFTGLPGRIAAAAAGLWDFFYDGFKAAYNQVAKFIRGLDFTIDVPDLLPGPDKYTIGFPDLPILGAGGEPVGKSIGRAGGIPRADGGPVWPGQDFWVGEHGPERVRFNQPGMVIPNNLSAAAGQVINVEIHNPVAEPATVSIPGAMRRAALAIGSR